MPWSAPKRRNVFRHSVAIVGKPEYIPAMTNTQNEQVRAGCYCRISSDPKDKRQGVDRQREDTTVLCEVQGWTPVGFYTDNDRSASNGKQRPEWERLLADVKAGKVDAIVIWNQDRGWRKMADFEALRPLLEPRGVLLATTNIGVIDVRNPDDLFRVQISTSMSEMEIAKMKVRMRRAARQKAEKGKPQWKRAFGYLPDTRDKKDDDGTRTPDPRTAPLVKEAYSQILAGGSISDVAREWNRQEAFTLRGKPWNAALVSQFLRKARNAGLRTHNCRRDRTERSDVIGPGTWPALVDEDVFWQVQAKLNAPGRAPGRKSVRQHLLTGVLMCGGCGHWLSGTWVMQKTGGQSGRPKAGQVKTHPGERSHRITYSCKGCHGCSVRAEHVEPLIFGLVSERLAQADAVDLLRAEHDETVAEALRTERATLLARLDEIADERADGDLTGAQAKRATERVNDKLADLDTRERDAERLRVFAGLPLGTPEVVAAVEGLSDDRLRAVLSVLATIRVQPVGKGHRRVDGGRFDRERVVVDWHC
jgi:DNA invertase Pin-like site-specific DNA recombinase